MVALCQFARNKQAEPGPVAPAGKKRFENMLQIIGMNPPAGVADRQLHAGRHVAQGE